MKTFYFKEIIFTEINLLKNENTPVTKTISFVYQASKREPKITC